MKRLPLWGSCSSSTDLGPYLHAGFVRGLKLCSHGRIYNTLYDTIKAILLSVSTLVRTPLEENYPPKLEVTFCVRGVISPLLANIYLHYVFDLWMEQWRKRHARGEVIVVRYADDFIHWIPRSEGCTTFPSRSQRTHGEIRPLVERG